MRREVTDVDRIGLEQKTLLFLLGHNLFAAPFAPSPDVNWEQVVHEAKAQAVFSVAFHPYAQLPLGAELSAKVRTTLLQHTVSNANCFKNHSDLHRLMQENGISYCSVKGAASAAYYPDPLLRSMGDVDFYVHPQDVDRVIGLFKEEGFVVDKTNHPSHIGMRNGHKRFELHFKPVAYREGRIGHSLEEYWSDILETAVLHEDELSVFYGPSVFHHGLILLTHLQHHLLQEGIGLRHVIDWLVFANVLSNEEFVTLFASQLKKIGLFRLAQLLALCGVKHMGMAHQAWMGDDYETADELLADILYGGNFGRKDRQRVYEGLFIGDSGTGTGPKGRLVRTFCALNGVVDYNWKWAKKCPLLYPVGWAYFSVRYLIRVALGKRELHLFDTYQKSEQRKKQYEKLRIFEPEE